MTVHVQGQPVRNTVARLDCARSVFPNYNPLCTPFQPRSLDRAPEYRGEDKVKLKAQSFKLSATVLSFLYSITAQLLVHPAAEAILLVPGSFPVPQENKLVLSHFGCSLAQMTGLASNNEASGHKGDIQNNPHILLLVMRYDSKEQAAIRIKTTKEA